MEAKYLLIVKVVKGLVVRDTPRPESQGGKSLRSVAVGGQLYAYGIHYIDQVPYARLVPLNPQQPEWVRVAEADGNTKYVDVIDLITKDGSSDVAAAITHLADAIRAAVERSTTNV